MSSITFFNQIPTIGNSIVENAMQQGIASNNAALKRVALVASAIFAVIGAVGASLGFIGCTFIAGLTHSGAGQDDIFNKSFALFSISTLVSITSIATFTFLAANLIITVKV